MQPVAPDFLKPRKCCIENISVHGMGWGLENDSIWGGARAGRIQDTKSGKVLIRDTVNFIEIDEVKC